ncbi:hypothetical protein HRR83_007951 [Exophiala dermatitidis]|uniref:Uncharacterized protein n=2 Tax=Exophiala dermatitidis TaxID=5970 RepID=H6BUP6_EXODN|nr:uncharacterized protein HMPREF1120_03859 [Exophiala dermatitidis NIH/UT8656]KAJ4506537.1 hypothetical protein HRR75_006778 [Exophiala dermatitidis]EHY55735.1 hypothetical protein HMPREF1120_03859 [Exophiala dermatitidis NIH/UT8656]KAJ4508804.1 hypothetical protein HRR74_007395 [Exophiala dermatitidis]KAJ4510056.1 hypothetical protein HRR73_006853 [Exophiala dermatitidis]KAJ4539058.1 hypothetical protein HRR77_006474 [Exophiala dermatitidis]
MAPIPLHTASPINTNIPSHPQAVSPSTAAARYTPVDAPATTTATPTGSAHGAAPSSQPARPGAPAVPQPTNTVSSTCNRRFEPTATVPADGSSSSRVTDSPPPPQPGAVPSPPQSTSRDHSPKLSIPPAPRPGDVPQWTPSSASPIRHAVPSPTPTHSRPVPLPNHQQSPSLYTPTRSIPPAGMTSNYPQDLSHPPGYMQDSRASFDDKPVEFCQPYENRASPTSSNRGGILDAEPTFDRGSDNESGVLTTAIAWAKAAGKKLSKTEEQIWRQINGDGKT